MEDSSSVSDGSAAEHAPPELTPARLAFSGNGTEYFRIWIVNLTLSLLTLGIYSAWAKVRTNRYFYGSTTLAGDTFEYHAEPLQILKGRIIAILALIVYVLAQTFYPLLSFILFGVLMLALPIIIVRSLRFNAIMSSWRGIRFGFNGAAWGAAKAYLLWPLFGLITVGFGMPYAWYKQNQYTVGNHRFGTTPAHSTATNARFYEIFFILMGLIIGMTILIAVLGVALAVAAAAGGGESEGESGGIAVVVMIWASYFLMYVVVYGVFQAMRYRLVYGNIVLDETRTQSDVVTGQWVRIVLLNSVLLVLTLGLYYPWARVKLTHYMISHTLVASPDLSAFVARTGEDESALGEELGEAFDLGIGV